MMRIFNYLSLIFLICICCPVLYGQQSINTSGNTINSISGKVSYSVGQVFFTSQSALNGKLRAGVQQVLQLSNLPLSVNLNQVFASAGGDISGNNGSLSYTIGQPFYFTKSSNTGKVRDGIQQPFLNAVMLNVHLNIEGYYQAGFGTLTEVIGSGISDTIMVELHNHVAPFETVFSKTILLDYLGQASAAMPATYKGKSYYIVFKHRNSIETWSKIPITLYGMNTINLKQ